MDWVDDDDELLPEHLHNISLGGLAFHSAKALPVGQQVKVCFPVLDPEHHLSGNVVWNKKVDSGFEIGIEFEDPQQLYRLRMIEQICHIEHYRTQVLEHEGRDLSSEEAAKEWIEHYATSFPTLDS